MRTTLARGVAGRTSWMGNVRSIAFYAISQERRADTTRSRRAPSTGAAQAARHDHWRAPPGAGRLGADQRPFQYLVDRTGEPVDRCDRRRSTVDGDLRTQTRLGRMKIVSRVGQRRSQFAQNSKNSGRGTFAGCFAHAGGASAAVDALA